MTTKKEKYFQNRKKIEELFRKTAFDTEEYKDFEADESSDDEENSDESQVSEDEIFDLENSFEEFDENAENEQNEEMISGVPKVVFMKCLKSTLEWFKNNSKKWPETNLEFYEIVKKFSNVKMKLSKTELFSIMEGLDFINWEKIPKSTNLKEIKDEKLTLDIECINEFMEGKEKLNLPTHIILRKFQEYSKKNKLNFTVESLMELMEENSNVEYDVSPKAIFNYFKKSKFLKISKKASTEEKLEIKKDDEEQDKKEVEQKIILSKEKILTTSYKRYIYAFILFLIIASGFLRSY